MIGISILLSMMGVDIDFIFDKNLGSRIYSLEKIDSSLLIGNIPIAQLWSDIIYANIMLNFGILGLIFFIIAILSPIIVYIKNKENNNIKKHLFYGYIIYLIISASDGALLLLPVMIFFWFVILVLTSKNLPSI